VGSSLTWIERSGVEWMWRIVVQHSASDVSALFLDHLSARALQRADPEEKSRAKRLNKKQEAPAGWRRPLGNRAS
jgi:hypothetical protein